LEKELSDLRVGAIKAVNNMCQFEELNLQIEGEKQLLSPRKEKSTYDLLKEEDKKEDKKEVEVEVIEKNENWSLLLKGLENWADSARLTIAERIIDEEENKEDVIEKQETIRSLRVLLFKLNQKKSLTKNEEAVRKKITLKLKQLDDQISKLRFNESN
jgi:hypothetical protein